MDASSAFSWFSSFLLCNPKIYLITITCLQTLHWTIFIYTYFTPYLSYFHCTLILSYAAWFPVCSLPLRVFSTKLLCAFLFSPVRVNWPVFLLTSVRGVRMISTGIAGKALVLGLHFTHRIHLEPDTSLNHLFRRKTSVVPSSTTFFLGSICGKFLWRFVFYHWLNDRRSIFIMVRELWIWPRRYS